MHVPTHVQTFRTVLTQLQETPDLESLWLQLQEEITSPQAAAVATESLGLLDAARRWHESRRDWDVVVRLLELANVLTAGSAREEETLTDLGRVLREELFDEERALGVYRRLLARRPDHGVAQEVVKRNEEKTSQVRKLAKQLVQEAMTATDSSLRSGLFTNAAEISWRYGSRKRKEVEADVIEQLHQALELDPKNRRAARLLVAVCRGENRLEEAAQALEKMASCADTKDDRLEAYVGLAHLAVRQLSSPERAAAAYERVLDIAPGHGEALAALAEFFSVRERWDELIALYEDQLRSGGVAAGQETNVVLRIAQTQWRHRERPEAAEPWFERLRRLEPAEPTMLDFFREWCGVRQDRIRLLGIISDAQRALPDGPERLALSAEIAQLAEGEANTAKAIEQYKALLRQDPNHEDARRALKRLYVQTEAWNALVELLRQQFERTAVENTGARLAVLRELSNVYRLHIKSDTALATVLTQIVQLDENDVGSVQDLVRVLEGLSRWRDLLGYQQKLAELTPDKAQKIALYRATARRWLEQFSNVQNAVEAYEALLQLDAADVEARAKLRELYGKRRAWPQLFALAQRELGEAVGSERTDLLVEMARLAAERLDRGADAIALYKQAISEEGGSPAVLDALEKQAEREKDFATVAEVLERRVELASDSASKLVVLQKLGAVYSDRLGDPAAATASWRRVLALQPGHAKALRVLRDAYVAANDLDNLDDLYASQNDWEGLAEVLSVASDRTPDPAWKVKYSLHAARVFEERIGQPERAARAYERVLSVRPKDEAAARALVPIYEKEERWARLLPLYEILLVHATRPEDQVSLYRRLADIAGQRLLDRPASVVYARRAYETDPTDPEALALLERTSRAAGTWDVLIEVLQAYLKKVTATPAEAYRIQSKLAEIFAGEQGNVDEAIAIYRSLVEANASDAVAVAALDRLLRTSDRREELRWLFAQRVTAANQEEKIALLREWATLEEDVFTAPDRAIVLYHRLLEVAPEDNAALTALSTLLLASGDKVGGADILTRRRDLATGSERADREMDLAALAMGALERPNDALAALVRVLELRPHDARVVSFLERLLPVPETRARAAVVLREEYATAGDARREANALAVMLETCQDPSERLGLFALLTDAYERKIGAAGTAFDYILRAVGEFPTELALWDRAAVLAKETGRPIDLAAAIKQALLGSMSETLEVELCERAARLHDERLGDVEAAIPYLERVLTRQPGNDSAFARLKKILSSTRRFAQLKDIYETISEATIDDRRKVELYAEVARLCDEVLGERSKAISFYERILTLDPRHEGALRALDTLYQAEKKPRELGTLLDRRLAVSIGEDARAIKLRLSQLYLNDLHEPTLALLHLDEVLQEDPSDALARSLVERILEVGSLRPRAAELLERVYEQRDDVRNLGRVLEIRLEFAENNDLRRELWRRIARLRDQRLQDDGSSFAALSQLIPLDPADTESRQRFLEIGRHLAAYEQVVVVLGQAAQAAESKGQKGEILLDLARVYEDFLGDRAGAEKTYRQVLELDPEDVLLALPAAHSLERIYAVEGNHLALVQTLQLEVRLEQATDVRRELWGRLGELYETVLDDIPAAIRAWQSRLDDDPVDDLSLRALERLYEKMASWRELVDILRAREHATQDAAERRRLLVKVAQTFADRLGDKTEAVQAWRGVVDEFGPNRLSFAALATLYEAQEEWHDLAATLEADLTLVDATDDRLELLARLGGVRRNHLDDLPGALDAYRQALTLRVEHAPVRASLEQLLDVAEARREAADLLRPLYEADSDYEKLLRVLEIEAELAELPSQRVTTLGEAVRIAEVALRDLARAFSYAMRAAKEAVGDDMLPSWIARLEGLARDTGRHAEFVDVLSEIAPDVLDEELRLQLTLRVAYLARERLADRPRARLWYEKALELRGDDHRTLDALASLYEEMGDWAVLFEVVKRQADAAIGDQERWAFLYQQARLCWEKLERPAEAIRVFETILDEVFDPPAVAALERLYTESERYDDLVTLYERQISGHPREEADLHVRLAGVLQSHLHDLPRAFDALEAALALHPRHGGATHALESILSESEDLEHRARAAEILEPVYLQRADWKRVMVTLDARLQGSADREERRTLRLRLAQLHEEQAEDYRAALEVIARLLPEDPTDEETRAELERLAKVAGAEERLADIYAATIESVSVEDTHTAKLASRAGELYAALRQTDRALVYLRRALAFEPDSPPLFNAVDALLIAERRPLERIELYRGALEHRYEPADRLRLLHTTAELEEKTLGNADQAVVTYRSALDVDEGNAVTLDALTRLYKEGARWRDLADLYLRRIEVERSTACIASFRLALAGLYRERLDDVGACIDQLEEIVRAIPTHAEALAVLETLKADENYKARIVEILRPLYEQADAWPELLRLNEQRLELAADDNERILVFRENARLYETRANDLVRAFSSTAKAYELNPEDDEVRADLERLAGMLGSWDLLAKVYERILPRTDGYIHRTLLRALALVHDTHRDDPRQALAVYDRLSLADETDPEPLESMMVLSLMLSDWPTHVRVLIRRLELVAGDEQRAEIWRQIGSIRRDMLDDPAGSVEAYERALELDPADVTIVDALLDLYEDRSDPARLVELYRRRVDLADGDGTQTYDLLHRMAVQYETVLAERPEAIDVLREALAVRPGDKPTLEMLDRLLRLEALWPELLDNLRLRIDVAESAEERALLHRTIGDIYREKLHEPADAIEAYRQTLAHGLLDDATVEAILAVGREREEFRLVVAEVLEPALQSAGRWEDLLTAYELRVQAQDDVIEKAQTLRAMATIAEQELRQPDRATVMRLRALRAVPDDTDLHADIERLAVTSEGSSAYADALAELANQATEPLLAQDLWSRLGRWAEGKLTDPARAVMAYRSALEQAGDTPELLASLDRLYVTTGDVNALADVLERRIGVENDPDIRAECLYRLAMVQLRDRAVTRQGLETLRRALEQIPKHAAAREALEHLTQDPEFFDEAASILETTYRENAEHDQLVVVLEKRVQYGTLPSDRIRTRLELARVLEEGVQDASRARTVLETALGDDVSDVDLLAELERLAAVTTSFASAALALDTALQASSDLSSEQIRDGYVRLAGWYQEQLKDVASAEQAFEKALDKDPESTELLRSLEDLRRVPGRELSLIETLRRRARLEPEPSQKQELLREAKVLAETVLHDAALTEAILRQLLDENEANLWALEELTALREAASDWEEATRLLLRTAEIDPDGTSALRRKRRAADLRRDRLADASGALALYEELFEDDATDASVAKVLRELYRKAGKYHEATSLLDRLIDQATSPTARTALRLELARLRSDVLEAPDDAIDTLRAVLDEEPGQTEAVIFLSRLYEETGKDDELAELLTAQTELAVERGDVAAELTFQVRLGDIYEARLGNIPKAIETYEAVLARDPHHRGALQAVARLYEIDGETARVVAVLTTLLDQGNQDDPEQASEQVDLARRLGDAHGKLGDLPAAIGALERALRFAPTDPALREQLQTLYEKTEQWEPLAELLVGNVPLKELAGEQVKLLRRAAEIHQEKRRDPAKAATLLERASTLVPDDRELLFALCDAYNVSGRSQDAITVLEKIVVSYGGRRSKELAAVQHRLAAAYLSQGDQDRAFTELEAAFKIDPGSIPILKDLGALSLMRGDLERAQKTYRALLLQKLDADAPISKAEVFFHLGEILVRQGDKVKAVQMLERALENNGALQSARDLLAELKG